MGEKGRENSGRKAGGRTLLGFDFGLRRIGVAIAQEQLGSARALATVRGDCPGPDWAAIEELIDEWRPDLVIVGRPAEAGGTDSAMTARAERFGRQINGRFQLAVATIDERFSSLAAEDALREQRQAGTIRRNKARRSVDSVAAQVILQAWLDRSGGAS